MTNNTYSVLVADDERLIAKNIARNIERCHSGFHVISITHNGEDALNTIQEHMPHVLFTDICMPVMDGLALIQKARELNPLLKCVIISGYNDFEYAKKAIQYGITDYLLKPVNSDELTVLLQNLEQELLCEKEHFHLERESKEYTTEELVQLVENYIKNNYASALDLGELSTHLGFSSSYLTKIFTKHLEITPSKYIRKYRMSIAKQLLSDEELSINDIARSVGYSDPFHFSKSFKLEMGISPTVYRENCKTKTL